MTTISDQTIRERCAFDESTNMEQVTVRFGTIRLWITQIENLERERRELREQLAAALASVPAAKGEGGAKGGLNEQST